MESQLSGAVVQELYKRKGKMEERNTVLDYEEVLP